MSVEQFIDDLLVRWEESREDGRPLSAGELCADRPELSGPVQARIDALEQVYAALNSETAQAHETVGDDGFLGTHTPPAGYDSLEYLGHGGGGVVYKAHEPKLNRLVALKFMHAGSLTPERLRRFEGEARAGLLQHPNIVQTYAVGESEGRPFLVIEYVDGPSLSQYAAGVPQEAHAAAWLVETLARAVGHAHDKGVVHRDLKPANILLQADRRDGIGISLRQMTPKIADFGIAKFQDRPSQTATGDVFGTPSYMAPEQIDRPTEVSNSADIHALGAILYELLTGRAPFAAPSAIETLQQVRTCEAVPPSGLQPGVPPDLENICLKCLQKDPQRRYSNAVALADDLKNFLESRPVSARPIGRRERLGRWCRRNPLVAALTGGLAAALLLGFALVTWKWTEADAARRQSDRNLHRIRQVVDEYLITVGDDLLLNEPGMFPLRERLLTSALAYYEELLDDYAEDEAVRDERIRVLVKVARIKQLAGSRTEARSHLRDALAGLQRSRDGTRDVEYQARLCEIKNALAENLIGSGDLTEALRLLPDAVEGSVRNRRQQIALARAHHNRGVIHSRLGDIGRAEEAFAAAVEIARSAGEPGPQLGRGLILLATQKLERGLHREARDFLTEATSAFETHARGDPRSWRARLGLSECHDAIGRLEVRRRQWAVAARAFGRSERVLRELVADNPQVVSLRTSLCRRLNNFGGALRLTQPVAATRHLRAAAELATELVSEDPANPERLSLLALSDNNLAALLSDAGNVEEAAFFSRRARRNLSRLVEENPDVVGYRDRLVSSLVNLADDHFEHARIDLGLEAAREAVEHGKHLVGQSPDIVTYRHQAARTLHKLGLRQTQLGNSKAGLDNLRAAIEQISRVAASESAVTCRLALAEYQLEFSSTALDFLDPQSAERSLEAARKLVKNLSIEDPGQSDPALALTLARVHFTIALLDHRQRRYRKSMEHDEQALAIVSALVAEYPSVVRYQDWLARVRNNLGNTVRLLGEKDRAEMLFKTSLETLTNLKPRSYSQTNALARAHINYGTLQRDQRKADEAVVSFRKAVELWNGLLREADTTPVRVGLTAACGNIGHVHWARRNAAAALTHYDEAIAHVDALLEREPTHVVGRQFRQNTLWGRARALNKLKRFADAAVDWAEVISLTPEDSRTLFRLELGWSQAKAGHHVKAAELATAIAADESEPDALFNCARLHAMAFDAVESDDELDPRQRREHQQRYSNRCVELLTRLEADGVLAGHPGRIRQLKSGADFRGVRSAPSCQELIRRLDGLPD